MTGEQDGSGSGAKHRAKAREADREQQPPSRPARDQSSLGRFPWLELVLIVAFLLTARKIARLS